MAALASGDAPNGGPIGKQEGIVVERVTALPATGDTARLLTHVLDTVGRLTFEQPADKGLQQSLGQAAKEMTTYVQKRWGPLLGGQARTENRQAILIAKWGPAAKDSPVHEVILWKAPEYHLVLLKLDPAVLSSPDRVKKFLQNTLVIPSHLDIHLVHFQMLPRPDASGLAGHGWVEFERLPAASAVGYGYELAAWSSKGATYLSFKLGKNLFSAGPTTGGR
jgi:hypothetical protein